jgi:multiple sugar transport system ATP-binding protein
MVFQNYALYPHMSVYDNMGFGLQMRHVPRQEIARRINEAAELLGLTHLLKRRPRELSGGQRQRVALGRAIVRDPAVFLMDEPLSNLDAQLRVQTRTEILRLHQRVTSTVMYVTHDQVEAMTMGDRIVVMKDGVVQQVDAPKAIYDHPRNRFVAGFIGSPPMNFLDCSLEREAGALYLRGASFRLRIPNARARALEHARSDVVTLGFRPEDVQIGPESGAATQPDASIPARIEVVETLGSEQHVFLTSDGASMLARVSADFSVRDGESVTALLNPAKLHVFDRDSGAAYTV